MANKPPPRDIPGNGRWPPDPSARDANPALRRAARLVALMANALVEDRFQGQRTRRRLSAELGVDEATLRRIEDGRTWPTLWVWTALAEEFGFEHPAGSAPLEDRPERSSTVDGDQTGGEQPDRGPTDPAAPEMPISGESFIELPLIASEMRRQTSQYERRRRVQEEQVAAFAHLYVVNALHQTLCDIYPDPKTQKLVWTTRLGVPTHDVEEALRVEVPVHFSLYEELREKPGEKEKYLTLLPQAVHSNEVQALSESDPPPAS